MYCTYKIYYNNSFVLITGDRAQINKKFAKVLDTEKDIEDFLDNPAILFDGHTNENILVVCPKPGENMCHFLDKMDIVIAGGGIVTNENDEVLLMFRRGMWDLPKGKIELNEKILEGAIREVEEETGVRVKSVDEKPITTYHAYRLKGKNCIKETSWFHMRAKDGQKHLTPQTEEDIEEVRWVKKEDLKDYKEIAYPLIWGLLSEHVLKPKEV